MQVSDDWLLHVAADAVRAVFPPERIGAISVAPGATFDGDDAYDFVVHVDQVDDRDEAARMRITLRRELRDRLTAEGVDVFPFVRIMDRVSAA